MNEGILYNQEQAEQRVRYWQQILRLQDYDVAIQIVRQSELSPDRGGECMYKDTFKQARIRILDPIDGGDMSDRIEPFCHEYLIVHELLHLHTWEMGAKADTPEGLCEEQAINAIARALVALDRRGK